MSKQEDDNNTEKLEDVITPVTNLDSSDPQAVANKQEFEHDEDIAALSAQMTASYSEISFSGHGTEVESAYTSATITPGPSRPLSLSYQSTNSSDSKPLDLDGVVVHDGDMTHFVADDLEYKIKLSSPVTKRGESPFVPTAGRSRTGTPMSASLYRQLLTPQIGQVDITVLNDLEYEARKIASSVDNLIENLSDILHSVSSLTAASVEAYRRSVGRACDALDRNIRAMYTVLARGEEVSRAMAPVRAHASRLAEIRRLLNIFESTL